MKTPLGSEADLVPGHTVLDGVTASAKGAQQPPLFGPCPLWPRSPISATAELLSNNSHDSNRVTLHIEYLHTVVVVYADSFMFLLLYHRIFNIITV